MRKFLQNKYWVLTLSMGALFALILLSAALKGVEFRPIQRIGEAEAARVQYSVGKVIEQMVEIPIWKQVALFAIIFLIVVLLSTLLSPELRKRLILSFLRFMAILVAFYYILKANPGLLEGLFGKPLVSEQALLDGELGHIPPPKFQAPHISSILSYVIAFGVILVVIVLLWGLSRWWARQSALLASQRTLDDLAAAARETIHELSEDWDSEDAIIQCYQRMSRAVGSKRGLHRESGMTASEFAARLEKAGLPRESVNRLTHLFEAVRYGARKLGQGEVNDAVACLTDILHFCGEPT